MSKNRRSEGVMSISSGLSEDKSGNGRRRTASETQPATSSSGSHKSSSQKSSKSRRKSRSSSVSRPQSDKKKKKKRGQGGGRSLFSRIAQLLGIFVGSVELKDARAIEAAQALNLKPKHLRKLKARFNQIDIDGSGTIDLEEFFEAVGEERSPFTDKLFALIGEEHARMKTISMGV